MKTLLLASTALGVLTATTALANDAAEIDALVVTAGRTEQPVSHVGGQISVLDQADLDARQTPVVTDILRRLPGVSYSRNGGVGTATQLRIRGAETGHTVVLIDGVKLNDPSATDSGYNAANLLVGDVARIELLRGAQSVLWGSQAIGGVINMIGAEPTAPFEGRAIVEGGALRTFDARLGVGGASGRVAWRAHASSYTTDGVSAFNAARGGRERDGYRNLGAGAKLTVRLSTALSADLRTTWSRGRTDIDGSGRDTPEQSRTRELIGYAGLNLALLDGRFANRAGLAYTRTDRDNLNPILAAPNTFDAAGQNRRLEYQGTFKVIDGLTAVFGAERERARFRTASPTAANPRPVPGPRKASLDGLYGLVSGQPMEGLTLSGGLRRDEHGDFGGHTVGQAAAAWQIGGTMLRASWGEGFKAPSLFQLGSDFGNLNLAPEEARTWDAGVEQSLLGGRVTLSAAWFARRTRGQIDFLSCPPTNRPPACRPGQTGVYDNITSSRAHGYELQARATPAEGLTLEANYTRTVSLNRSPGANFDKWLTRRPRNQANLDVTYDWRSGLSARVSATYAGKSYDDAANRNVVSGIL